jgi:hypothetical protein
MRSRKITEDSGPTASDSNITRAKLRRISITEGRVCPPFEGGWDDHSEIPLIRAGHPLASVSEFYEFCGAVNAIHELT